MNDYMPWTTDDGITHMVPRFIRDTHEPRFTTIEIPLNQTPTATLTTSHRGQIALTAPLARPRVPQPRPNRAARRAARSRR